MVWSRAIAVMAGGTVVIVFLFVLVGIIPGFIQTARFERCAIGSTDIQKSNPDLIRKHILICAREFDIKDADADVNRFNSNDGEVLTISIHYSVYMLYGAYPLKHDSVWQFHIQ